MRKFVKLLSLEIKDPKFNLNEIFICIVALDLIPSAKFDGEIYSAPILNNGILIPNRAGKF